MHFFRSQGFVFELYKRIIKSWNILVFFLIFTTFKNIHNSKISKEIQEQLFRLAMWPMSLSIVYVVVPVVFVFIVAVVFVKVCLVNGCYNVYLFKIVCYCICIVVVSLLFLCLLMLLSSFWWCCFCCWYSCLSDIIELLYTHIRTKEN